MQGGLRFAVLMLAIISCGCGSLGKYPVDAMLLEEPVRTNVDSLAAQYYLNHYLQNDRDSGELDHAIFTVYQKYPAELPSRTDLKAISQQFSNDFAALFLADRLWQDDQNRRLQRSFHRQLAASRDNLLTVSFDRERYLILLVPGWNYVTNGPVTGSDFSAPREMIDQLGIENHLLLVPPNGSVMQSAEVIVDAIRFYSDSGKKILLVGASAAGPAIHYSLGFLLDHQEAKQVYAWINIGGILRGSPLIDYFQSWPQKLVFNMVALFRGWDKDEIMTMSARQSRERVKDLHLPPDLLVINYIGLSLSGDLSSLSRYKYPILADEGPNDGLTPLVDIIAPGSLTLVATRSDHYFSEDSEIELKTVAMVKMVIEMIEQADRNF